jgi:membrane protease YdiL (CAAX protease family)
MGAETDVGIEDPAPDWRVAVTELLVFCFLIVPSMAASFFIVRGGNTPFAPVAVAVMLRDGALVSLVAYFLWRNGEGRRCIGWRFERPVREALLGCALFVPFFFGMSWVAQLLISAGMSAPKAPPGWLVPSGSGQTALAVVLVSVVAVCEETIFRGYLILRLRQATRSAGAAVLISSVVFSIGHGYEGTAGVAVVGLMGVALALVYLWRGSLVAPMTMHFLQDLIGVVLAPLMFAR